MERTRPALFLDRDGVLNEDRSYLHRSEDFHWIRGAREAIRTAKRLGYLVIVVTNQSGVARGLFQEDAVRAIHNWMQEELATFDPTGATSIDAFYYCPHLPDPTALPAYRAVCPCRKPAPGMFLQAIEDFGIDAEASIVIGDKQRDLEAGAAAGVRSGFLFPPGANLHNFLLEALTSRLAANTVICAGDVILDRFVYGEVTRISPEAPIPVLHTTRTESMLGGAGNAARNIVSLGSRVLFLSVTGGDANGAEVRSFCTQLHGCEPMLEIDPLRITSAKTRFVAHGQQLLRADTESTEPIDAERFRRLLARFEQGLADCNAVLLSDYAKGVLSGANASELINRAQSQGVPVVVDPKGTDFSRYTGATLLKPNIRELAIATGARVETAADVENAARLLIAQTNTGYVVVTRGSGGITLVPAHGEARTFPAMAREVYDVTGAGDTVAAVIAAAFAAKLPVSAAVEMANIAAGIVVGKVGTATVSRAEILSEYLTGGPAQSRQHARL